MYHSGNELINPFKILERLQIQAGWQVADLGCGSLGHFVFPAAQFVGGEGRVYAVDIQKMVLQAIESAAKAQQYWNVQTVWSDIEVPHATHIPSNSLDLTIVANNLYLSQHREGLVQEAFRLTKPGGLILVIEWKAEPTVIGPAPEHRLSQEDARQYFSHAELSLEDAYEAGDCHYALVYRRHPASPAVMRLSAVESELLGLHPSS